ncbi:MAG TPA: F0F1 ATP synthase subunit B [Thermoanaerobaculia bacterium]|jgi:F-type H+-transporting ATPase subunit b|nr:F0F1 ATP synthase subunit B [Thermoanaerobaculia bacterium]
MMERALIGLVSFALAAPAFAAEAAEHGEAGGGGPFAGDIGNALWTLLIFGLVVFILGRFAWGPILKGLQSREDFIRESLEKAQHASQQAEARLREYEERLASSRAEATAIVDEARRDAEVVKRKIEADAHAEYEKMIDRAKREIQIATDTATKDLYTLSARLATDMASRVLGREVTAQDQERLIAESINELNQRPH